MQNIGNEIIQFNAFVNKMMIDVEFQIHFTERNLPHLSHGRLKIPCPDHFLKQFFGDGFAGFIMLGKEIETLP